MGVQRKGFLPEIAHVILTEVDIIGKIEHIAVRHIELHIAGGHIDDVLSDARGEVGVEILVIIIGIGFRPQIDGDGEIRPIGFRIFRLQLRCIVGCPCVDHVLIGRRIRVAAEYEYADVAAAVGAAARGDAETEREDQRDRQADHRKFFQHSFHDINLAFYFLFWFSELLNMRPVLFSGKENKTERRLSVEHQGIKNHPCSAEKDRYSPPLSRSRG